MPHEGFNKNLTEELQYEGNDENGIPVYGESKAGSKLIHDETNLERKIDLNSREIKDFLEFVNSHNKDEIGASMIWWEVTKLVKNGYVKDDLLSLIEPRLISGFKHFFAQYKYDELGRSLIQSMKNILIRIGVDENKLIQ